MPRYYGEMSRFLGAHAEVVLEFFCTLQEGFDMRQADQPKEFDSASLTSIFLVEVPESGPVVH